MSLQPLLQLFLVVVFAVQVVCVPLLPFELVLGLVQVVVQEVVQEVVTTSTYSRTTVVLGGGGLSPALVLAAVLLLAVLAYLWRSGARRDTVLLVGPSGGGKTALYRQLRYGTLGEGTVTSMRPNEGVFGVHEKFGARRGRKLKVTDFPGHPRLQAGLLHHLPTAKKIVFVVDATNADKKYVIECAQMLYQTLAAPAVHSAKVPVLLLCNKTDNIRAQSVTSVLKQLEAEITRFRDTQGSLDSAGGGTRAPPASSGPRARPSGCRRVRPP